MPPTPTTSDVFSAIAEPRRRQIIDLLSRGSGLAVGAIVLSMGLPQPAVSKHLGVLREVGIVRVTKEGQHRVYELNVDQLRPVYDWIKTFERHWDRQLDRIRERAERKAAAISKPDISGPNSPEEPPRRS
jgi:DNA-binding transcriptional ArsR family regulator